MTTTQGKSGASEYSFSLDLLGAARNNMEVEITKEAISIVGGKRGRRKLRFVLPLPHPIDVDKVQTVMRAGRMFFSLPQLSY